MKKICYLLLMSLTLIACSSTNLNNEETVNYYSQDLTTLLKASDSDFSYPNDFYYSGDVDIDNEYYQYTLVISYKNIKIEGIKIIAMPYSFNLNTTISKVCNVGYDHEINLASNVDVENHDVKAIELTYKYTKSSEDIKFLVRYNDKVNIVKVNL